MICTAPLSISAQQRAERDRIVATENLSVYVAELQGEVVGVTCMLLMPNLTYDGRPTAFIDRSSSRATIGDVAWRGSC